MVMLKREIYLPTFRSKASDVRTKMYGLYIENALLLFRRLMAAQVCVEFEFFELLKNIEICVQLLKHL